MNTGLCSAASSPRYCNSFFLFPNPRMSAKKKTPITNQDVKGARRSNAPAIALMTKPIPMVTTSTIADFLSYAL